MEQHARIAVSGCKQLEANTDHENIIAIHVVSGGPRGTAWTYLSELATFHQRMAARPNLIRGSAVTQMIGVAAMRSNQAFFSLIEERGLLIDAGRAGIGVAHGNRRCFRMSTEVIDDPVMALVLRALAAIRNVR